MKNSNLYLLYYRRPPPGVPFRTRAVQRPIALSTHPDRGDGGLWPAAHSGRDDQLVGGRHRRIHQATHEPRRAGGLRGQGGAS